jgi:hypothetical protein
MAEGPPLSEWPWGRVAGRRERPPRIGCGADARWMRVHFPGWVCARGYQTAAWMAAGVPRRPA